MKEEGDGTLVFIGGFLAHVWLFLHLNFGRTERTFRHSYMKPPSLSFLLESMHNTTSYLRLLHFKFVGRDASD